MHIMSTILERGMSLDADSIALIEQELNVQNGFRKPRYLQRQVKHVFFSMYRERVVQNLRSWGAMMWTIHNRNTLAQQWTTTFAIFVLLTLVIDKMLFAIHSYHGQIEKHQTRDESENDRVRLQELERLIMSEIFVRCKEIFHWKFKTRKAGREATNPIRDGLDAFRGTTVDSNIDDFVRTLQEIVLTYGTRSQI